MMSKKTKMVLHTVMALVTILMVFPFLWMLMMSFKTNSEIISNPLAWPKTLNWSNYRNALHTLNYPRLYANTFIVCAVSIVIELVITFLSSFALARMTYRRPNLTKAIYAFLIAGLSVSPFILLFPVYKIYLKALPVEIDEAAIIDGCSIWDLMIKVILPMTKPVIATVVIFNVLYIWNEYPFASVMLRSQNDYTLSMGASFFKGTYTVDYGGIVASSVMIIIPELVFYGLFQKKIVGGMVAGAVKG